MDKEQMKINKHIVRIQGEILRDQLRIVILLEKIIDELEELKKKQK